LTAHRHEHHGVIGRVGGMLAGIYRRSLRACLNAPLVVVLVSLLFAAAAYGAFGMIRQELTPNEDRSRVMLRISAPQGVSLDYTVQQVKRIEQLIKPLRDSGEVLATFANVGTGGSVNSAFMVLPLAPWEERQRSQQEIM